MHTRQRGGLQESSRGGGGVDAINPSSRLDDTLASFISLDHSMSEVVLLHLDKMGEEPMEEGGHGVARENNITRGVKAAFGSFGEVEVSYQEDRGGGGRGKHTTSESELFLPIFKGQGRVAVDVYNLDSIFIIGKRNKMHTSRNDHSMRDPRHSGDQPRVQKNDTPTLILAGDEGAETSEGIHLLKPGSEGCRVAPSLLQAHNIMILGKM